MKSRNPDISEALTQAGYVKSRPQVTLPHHSGLGTVATADNPVAVRYARSALERQCADLKAVTEGSRNHETNRSAYKIGMLVGAGLLDADTAMEALVDASMATGLPEWEARLAVTSGLTGGITNPKTVTLTATEIRPAAVIDDPGGTKIPSDVTPSGNAADGPDGQPAPETPRDHYARRVFTLRTARERPPIEWVIDQWLATRTFARLVGSSGTFKTFVMIDMALRVALGLPWHGRPTTRCKVHYMVGEGVDDFTRRLDAWCEVNDVDADDLEDWFTFTDGVAHIGSSEWIGAVEWCEDWKAGFIIGDTQARLTPAYNENDTQDASKIIRHVDHLKMATGACVLLVHHTGHENGNAGDRGRGAYAFKAAADTEMILRRQGKSHNVGLFLDKAKAAEDGISQRLDVIKVGPSLAVSPESLTSFDVEMPKMDGLANTIVDVLNGATDWVTTSEIYRVVKGTKVVLIQRLKTMVDDGVIRCSAAEGIALPRGATGYRLP